jgi:hypothetical protein
VNPCFKSFEESSISIGDAMMVIVTKRMMRNNATLDFVGTRNNKGLHVCTCKILRDHRVAKTDEEINILLDGLANIRGSLMARKAASSCEHIIGGYAVSCLF